MSPPILSIDKVSMRFGGIIALNKVSLNVQAGTIHAVIGPNGAGKSTLLNIITGIYSPSSGRVRFQGKSIAGLPPHHICRQGICRSFQNTELFGNMSALDNVRVGFHLMPNYSSAQAIFHGKRYLAGEAQSEREAFELLDLVGLAHECNTLAASLPFGKQRRLEIARALATRPQLLLLDEPAAGLRGTEIEELNDILMSLCRTRGLSILLIDHVMALVMKVSHRITVLNFGQRIAEGLPDEVRQSPAVIEAYLGKRGKNAVAA